MSRLFALGYFRRLVAISTLLVFTGCALAPFFGHELNVPYRDLNERIGQRFPMERNIADLLTVALMRPRVSAILANSAPGPQTQAARLSVTIDLQVKLPSLLNASQRSFWGSMKLSGAPRYDARSKAVVLVGAKLDQVRVDNMPDALSAALAKAASQLAKEYLDDKPIYPLTAAQVGLLGLDAGNASLSFVVLADRLVIAKQ